MPNRTSLKWTLRYIRHVAKTVKTSIYVLYMMVLGFHFQKFKNINENKLLTPHWCPKNEMFYLEVHCNLFVHLVTCFYLHYLIIFPISPADVDTTIIWNVSTYLLNYNMQYLRKPWIFSLRKVGFKILAVATAYMWMRSFGLWHSVVWHKFTDNSKKASASIFSVEMPLNVLAACSFEVSVKLCQTTRHHIPDDHHHKDWKYNKQKTWF